MSLFRFNKRYSLAVTAADNWLANAIIRGLLSDAGKSELRVQALTQYPNDPNVLDLKKHGAEIDGINYKRPDSLTNSLRNTNAIIFVAEVDKDRIQQAQAMAKAAKKANVEGAIVLSVEGAGKADLDTQHDFDEIEKIWKDSGLNCVAVLQLSFIQQGFFLLSPAVQHTGKLLWLPQKQEKFTPVNLHDVILSIQSLFASHKGNFVSLDKKHNRKTYLLTGPDSIDGRNIVNDINKAIHGEGEVELRNVDRSELGRYLSRLGNGKERERERDRDLGLTQRTAAQFIHNGFASLHESFAELIKGNQYNLERGVNTFNDGVDFLERAISFLEDDQFENQRTRVMHSADNFDIRRIVAPLKQLRNSRIERVINLMPEERAIYLDELIAIVEQMKSRVDVGSLRHHNEPQHEENYPVPFLPLQEIEVRLILDILEFVNTGKAGKKTDDVEHITHHKPEAVTSFFKKNYKKFVPDNQNRHGDRDERDNYSRNAIADREGRSRL